MTVLAIIAGLLVLEFWIIPNLSDEKTKLFRRLWSTEYARPTQPIMDAQESAVDGLLALYGIDLRGPETSYAAPLGALMGDALVFDQRNSRNGGILVSNVLLRTVRLRLSVTKTMKQ